MFIPRVTLLRLDGGYYGKESQIGYPQVIKNMMKMIEDTLLSFHFGTPDHELMSFGVLGCALMVYCLVAKQ